MLQNTALCIGISLVDDTFYFLINEILLSLLQILWCVPDPVR